MLKRLDRWVGDILLGLLGVFKYSKNALPKAVKKILVIKLIAMGDLIVITPLIRTLKQAYPDATIDLLATPRVAPIVDNMTLYRRVFYWSFGLDFVGSFIKNLWSLRQERYDLVFDLEFYYRLTTLLAVALRPRYLMGFDLQPSRTRLFDSAVAYDEQVHVADAFLNMAKALGIKQLDTTLEPLQTPDIDLQLADFIMIHVGTSPRATSRRWNPVYWSDLISRLSETHLIVLVGGQEESDIMKAIILPNHNVRNLIGQLNIPQTAALMKRASLYVGLDTGPTHLAAAMGTPVVAMYGPNTPDRWGPYTQNARILYKPNSCSPCTRQYEGVVSSCRDNQCMMAISVDDVMNAIHSLIM